MTTEITKIKAENNIAQLVKWKWGAICYCKYKDGNWEIFEWASDDIAQPTNAEIEAEIPNYQTVLDNKATADEEAKAKKETDKASAKAKLVAGEPLTEAEADTLVL